MKTSFLNEQRCRCGKLLLRGIFLNSVLEIKCKRCGWINKIGHIKLTDDTSHYILIINNQGKISNISDSASLILGYPGEELIGKSFTEINPTIPKEIRKKFIGPESVLNEDNFFQLETIHQTKDGENVPITVFIKLYNPNSDERYVLLAAELKNAVISEETSAENVPKFMDNACDFYFCIDKAGVGESVSPTVEKIFGFPPQAIIGKNYFDSLPVQTREQSEEKFKYFSSREQPYRVAHNLGKATNSQEIHCELYFTPNFDANRRFCGYRVLGWVTKKP